MARSTFGGSTGDWLFATFQLAGHQLVDLEAGTLTLWSAETGGTQHTNLLLNGGAVSSIPVGADGQIPLFQGPDGVTSLWGDAGGRRILMVNAESSATAAATSATAAAASAASVNRGVANGTASLDASTLVPDAQIPLTAARTANRPINLRDFAPTIDFTGVANSATALQSALTSAGARVVEFSREPVIRCDAELTLPQHQTLKGSGQYLLAGNPSGSELRFPNLTGTQTGVTGGGNNVIEDMLIRGPGATVGTTTVGFKSATGSPRFYRTGFFDWVYGTQLTNAYYTVFEKCEWRRNQRQLVTSGCYNMHLDAPTMYCAYGASDATAGRGISGTARGMTITGGSIEGYGAGGAIRMVSQESLRVDGTYFETQVVGSSAWGIIAESLDKVNITLSGLMVYLNEHSRFVQLGGSTNVTINSWGNKFVCVTGSSTAPTAYYFSTPELTNVRGRIGYDDWSEVVKAGTTYILSGILALGDLPNIDVRHPSRSYMGGDICGTGSPESVVPGPIGAIYRRLDGGASTSIYVKTSGTSTSGWTAK